MHMCIEKILRIVEYQTRLIKTGRNDRYVLLVTFCGDQS
jgi:hypothetical protein